MNPRPLLQRLVEMAGGPAERGYVLALSDGLDEMPETIEVGGVRYAVRHSESELAVRRAMWRSNGAPFIALVPLELAKRLPPDLVRGARGQRVHALDASELLGLALGVQLVGVERADVIDLGMAHLQALRAKLGADGGTMPTAVDAQLLDELILETILDLRLRGSNAAMILARLLTLPPTDDPRLVALLVRFLPQRFGAEGRVLAWALGSPDRPRAIAERGLLLAIEGAEMPMTAWGPIADARTADSIGLPPDALRGHIARLAELALEPLGTEASKILAAAERLGAELLTPDVLAKSALLPSGLLTRADAIAARAAGGEAIGIEDIEWLRAHRAAPHFPREIEAVSALARLSRAVADRASDTSPGLESQVRRYQTDDAFADVAAIALRRALASTDRFHMEARAVFDRWRRRRDEANRRFALDLSDDYERSIHDRSLVPVHRIWERVVLPRMRETTKGVFVLILDGCSYPVFIEIIAELARDQGRPIGLEVEAAHGTAIGAAGLAILPSVTSHSRGALVLGEIPANPLIAELKWRTEDEARTDKARFAQNRALGSRRRQLFLKGDVSPDTGRELRAALTDPDIEVVAAVFNTVDEMISSSSTSTPLEVRVDRIAGLLPTLRAALDAGRSVLVTADHGHTLFAGTDFRAGPGAAPRYYPLKAGEEPLEGFIAIDLAGLGGTSEDLAFAWRMSTYVGQQPQVGFHGGCALEELVVPMAWLKYEGVPIDEPAWWLGAEPSRGGDGGRIASAPRSPIPTSDGDRTSTSPRPPIPARPPAPPAIRGVPPHVLEGLEPTERDALRLIAQSGTVSQSDLSQALGLGTARVTGFMRGLRQSLDTAGLHIFDAEMLPSGEWQYHHVPPSADNE